MLLIGTSIAAHTRFIGNLLDRIHTQHRFNEPARSHDSARAQRMNRCPNGWLHESHG